MFSAGYERGGDRFGSVIKSISTLITQNSRHSGECLLFQAIQDNAAHVESKSVSFPLANAKPTLNDFVYEIWYDLIRIGSDYPHYMGYPDFCYHFAIAGCYQLFADKSR